MGLILNLETATRSCSVAIGKDGQQIGVNEEYNEKYSHAEKLTVFIEELLKASNVSLKDLDAIAVSQGPGSYTGLRIGVSTAKGLCYSLGIPLIGIETLKGIANSGSMHIESDEPHSICAMIDARRMEVYSTFYDSKLNETRPIQADLIEEGSYSDLLDKGVIYFVGDAVEKCQPVLSAHSNARFLSDVSVSSTGMITLSEAAFLESKFEDVAYFEPFYLKDFVPGKPKKLL